MRRISAMAETYYILIAPHNPNGPIETPVSVHLSAAIPNLLIFEHALSLPWHDRVQIDLVVLKDGYFEFPTPPGLGVELDMDPSKQQVVRTEAPCRRILRRWRCC